MPQTFIKDPDAVLDYQFDWSAFLATDETIVSYTLTADTGITIDSDSDDGEIVTLWVSSGTPGEDYNITCHIETNNSPVRKEDKVMTFNVR